MSILVVEPYPTARTALTTLLRQEGLTVVSCTCQRQAIELARTGQVDTIVTEIVFHGGQPCGDYVRRLHLADPDATLVVVSGLVGCHDLAWLGYDDPIPGVLRSGATMCLPKPIDVTELLRHIGLRRTESSRRAGRTATVRRPRTPVVSVERNDEWLH